MEKLRLALIIGEVITVDNICIIYIYCKQINKNIYICVCIEYIYVYSYIIYIYIYRVSLYIMKMVLCYEYYEYSIENIHDIHDVYCTSLATV